MAGETTTVEFRSLLEHEQAELRARLAELGLGDAGRLDYDANFADTSQVTAERGEAEALAANLGETLTEVQAALGRLDDGTYGACSDCGQQIAAARLEAKPEARYCINCAAKH